jgi:hypothetical protein
LVVQGVRFYELPNLLKKEIEETLDGA